MYIKQQGEKKIKITEVIVEIENRKKTDKNQKDQKLVL